MPQDAPKIRLHLDAQLREGTTVALEREQANYLAAVMRLGPGARVVVFNAHDGEWLAEAGALSKRAGELSILERTRPSAPPPDLWLLFAPIKKARTDFIVEKACELGCRKVVPVFTALTNSERVNTERLRAHMIEAAEQCGLVWVPEMAEPAKLDALLVDWPADRRLLFCNERGGEPVAAALARAAAAPAASWAVIVGPEGGFTEAEAARLAALPGALGVSLGPRILRADTAAVAAITLWQAALGDWSGG
ncbi:MAG: 16S rRNA (uracil(1498)-N(3))-methyltransferase [Pseudomonadota bacterium]